MNKYAVYERIKAEIARAAKTTQEYEKRIKALQKKLRIGLIHIDKWSEICYNI